MQYILSQEEMDGLTQKSDVVQRDSALAAAREKILSLTGFYCVHDNGGKNYGGYCDDCPCSKTTNKWKPEWDRVCWLKKRYSK